MQRCATSFFHQDNESKLKSAVISVQKVLLFFVTQSFLSIRENISDVGCMDQKWGVTSLPEIAAAMFPKPAVCISQVCHWFATPKSLSNSKCTGPEIVRGYNTSFTLKGFTILTKNQSRNFCNTLSKIKFLKVFFGFILSLAQANIYFDAFPALSNIF